MKKNYSQVLIYYFSGTGNSKNTAICIKDEVLKFGIEVQIIDIAKLDKRVDLSTPKEQETGQYPKVVRILDPT